MQRDSDKPKLPLRAGRARFVGYAGRGGEAAASRLRSAQAAFPEFSPVVSAPAESSVGNTAFALASGDHRSLVTAAVADGSFIVMSGRVFDQVAASDMLESWLRQGVAAFTGLYFHGFVAAWDAKSSRFALIRDRYGVETGYYAETEGGMVFADDQQALLRLGIDATPNPVAIDTFLTCGYFAAPLTPYVSIKKLGAGCAVGLVDGHVASRPWGAYEPSDMLSYRDALAQAAPLVRVALQRTWPSDGEVGLLLSGGIDSAMLLVGMTEMLGESVNTFTFRYEDYEGHLNEGVAASLIAKHLQMPHEEIRIRPQDLIDDLDSAVAAYGEPLNWGLHSYRLGPIAERGIGTVFSGAGADGTGVAKRHRAALRFKRLPAPIRRALRSGVRVTRPLGLSIQEKAEWVTRQTIGLGDLFSPDSDSKRALRSQLYADPELAVRGGELLQSIYDDVAARLDPDKPEISITLMDKYFTSAEAMLAWNRAWPREHGLASRLPYYDPDLIELGLHIEGDVAGKDLMREVAERSLPRDIARAPKIAQQMPVGHWLRGPLAGAARERLTDLPPAMGELFDSSAIGAMIDRHVVGSADFGAQIVSLLTLASWYDQQSD